jgi:transposase
VITEVEIHKRSVDRAVAAAEYRRAGLTYRAIAEQFGGLHVSTAHSLVKKGERILEKRAGFSLNGGAK